MYAPYTQEQINFENGLYRPSTVHNRNNVSFAYWERALFQRVQAVIKLDGLPEEWEGTTKDFYYYCLLKLGYLVQWNSSEFGITFQPCALAGFDWYYQPTTAIIANPKLSESLSLEIGKDCELIKLTPDFTGIWDIIDYYAEKLSLLDNAVNVSLINAKTPKILAGKTKAVVQALKKMMDKVNQGNPSVFMDGRITDDPTNDSTPFQYIDLNVNKETYLTPLQLQDVTTLLNAFDKEIGIPTVPYQKKERMVTSEADSTKIESIARVSLWIETLNSSYSIFNKKYGYNITASLRFPSGLESDQIDAGGEMNE